MPTFISLTHFFTTMLSKAKLKTIRALALKRFRDENGQFLAEGHKAVSELAGHLRCRLLCATEAALNTHPTPQADEICTLSDKELAAASQLKTPQGLLAVFDKPTPRPFIPDADKLALLLDGVQDPGNLGTIIRIADWFGIKDIICSTATADAYGPKVVQATMGALARVNLVYTNPVELLKQLPEDYPVYGTFMEGRNLYDEPLTAGGLIIMGNEGNGISPEVAAIVTHKIHIPPYPAGSDTVESLNVAMATAITCSEFRRRCH